MTREHRIRTGAFYTPKQWVELSQKYIKDYLGDDWQEDYYIWDCAAGTGNLLVGLTNKYKIFASTLDQADVNVMHERIEHGANLLKSHVFQFDFLNDDFSKLPKSLQDIINDPEKRKKLVVYINPPYRCINSNKCENENHKTNVYKKYKDILGSSKKQLFIQFLTRIYFEIPNCMIVNFSTIANIQSPTFKDFRNIFQAKLEKLFLTPANTFDNVKGEFPIGFFIWNTSLKEKFEQIDADVFDKDSNFHSIKKIESYDNLKLINDWFRQIKINKLDAIGSILVKGNDFQHQKQTFFEPIQKIPGHNQNILVSKDNLIETCIYYSVRHCISADWLNDRDQFLWPNDGWKSDLEFQNDCLAFTLFLNNIQSKFGINHWIPFTESEVNAKEVFESNFMVNFINGKIKRNRINLIDEVEEKEKPLEFSVEAKDVFDAGREIFKYYHSQENINVNASLYDIRKHFQGITKAGRMNPKSKDSFYNSLIKDLRLKLKVLANKISIKVYEYEFLK